MLDTAKTIALALSVILLLALISYLAITKANLQSDMVKANEEIVALQIANKEFIAKVKADNDAFDYADKIEKQREEEAQTLIDEARKESQQYKDYAEKISAAKPTDNDDCKAALKLINNYIASKK